MTALQEARQFGYRDALEGDGKWSNSWQSPKFRAAYDLGYQDGQVIRAARLGQFEWPTRVAISLPRLALASDLVCPGSPEFAWFQDQEMQALKKRAGYFLQYLQATDQLSFAVPHYVLETLKNAEQEAKDVTGIAKASGEFNRDENLRISRLAEKSVALGLAFSGRPECGQCEGTGRTPSASNFQDEVCPVCDGTGKEYKM